MEVTVNLPTPLSYDTLFTSMAGTRFRPWGESIVPLLEDAFGAKCHGLLSQWCSILESFPESNLPISVDDGAVALGDDKLFDESEYVELLKGLSPWRKGPWKVGSVHIDTEWHSDWKWDRVAPHISDLTGKSVLDVGCGSGYHAYRMALAGAERVIGIDPGQLSVMQSQLMQRLGEPLPVWVLPMRIEDMAPNLQLFDTVFSMGVLYHRKSPIEHLLDLKGLLRSGGELVLETLVVHDTYGDLLFPEDRYAKMCNVWFLPTVQLLIQWLERVGFKEVRCVDCTTTTVDEQRSTEWMMNESLPDFLDPSDHTKTIEGYPAPLRATLLATK